MRPFAISIDLVDKPSFRKRHSGNIPLIGGIAMFFGVLISILILPYDLNYFNYFILVSIILVVIGVLDDHRNLSVKSRFLFQFLVAVIIISGGGLSIESFGDLFGNGEIFLHGWAYFISLIAIIAAINAVNMADGIHGLAAGNSLITFAAILFLSIGNIPQIDLMITLLFCSVLPVFMIHNLCLGISINKRVFMGDAGSMFLGMGIVWLLLDSSQGEAMIFKPVISLWVFSAPLMDMVSAFIRRLLVGKSPFKPDLFHLHHLLLHMGFKNTNALILILLFSFIMALIGILGSLYEVAEVIMFSGFLVVFLAYIVFISWAKSKTKNNTEVID